MSGINLHFGKAEDVYEEWETPNLIISDGAYGLGGFPGDPKTTKNLSLWYENHVRMWSEKAISSTTLWFWNTEIGWALVHPLLEKYGWKYVQTIIWDKGIGHISGNVNSKTIRRFPTVTEICVFYQRAPVVLLSKSGKNIRNWLRQEWKRSELPLYLANIACGVKNAATRKYLTQDSLWYFPPHEMLEKLALYANQYGKQEGKPYFSLNKNELVIPSSSDWEKIRYPWTYEHGITNVWDYPPLKSSERYKQGSKTLHLNQKPIELMKRIIKAASNTGDVVWEPLGGLCTASVTALEMGRKAYAAECNKKFFLLARDRLERKMVECYQRRMI